jgi:hypothetical protein
MTSAIIYTLLWLSITQSLKTIFYSSITLYNILNKYIYFQSDAHNYMFVQNLHR